MDGCIPGLSVSAYSISFAPHAAWRFHPAHLPLHVHLQVLLVKVAPLVELVAARRVARVQKVEEHAWGDIVSGGEGLGWQERSQGALQARTFVVVHECQM